MDLTPEPEPEVAANAYARTLGRAIACLRRRHHLSQTALAAEVGLMQPTLSRIERGTERPDEGVLQKIAAVFHVSPEDLTGEVEIREARERERSPGGPGRLPLSPDERRTEMYWVRLNGEERRLLQKLSGQLQILRHADLFREGLKALKEREQKKMLL